MLTSRQSEITAEKAGPLISEDFLLQSDEARTLYFDYAANLPVIDYHNHLSPEEIAADKKFENITQIWLNGDHYKWRAMRTLGVSESLITGNTSDRDKFFAWANCLPQTVRNPLFHWSQMELKNPFQVDEYLTGQTAAAIYDHCNARLQQDDFSTRGLLQRFNVEMVGTTDDPCDDLAYHQQLSDDGFCIKVLPSFRPDKAFAIGDKQSFLAYLALLSQVSNVRITSIDTLIQALAVRVDYFHQHGCRIADHGLTQMPAKFRITTQLEQEFERFISDASATQFSDPDHFCGVVLLALCKMYAAKGWVQQLHLGPLRNNNTRLLQLLGKDAGVDSIGDLPQANNLAAFLNALDSSNELGKTIIYNINPADNELFATMCGNFNGGDIRGKVQYGSGWWFLDQKDGMERQLNALSNMGIVSTFIGMTTDSRSFLSYSRHEYFRRTLCNLFGEEMKNGILPNEEEWIGKIIQNICYYNAKEYFCL